jgi:hypothetical protein
VAQCIDFGLALGLTRGKTDIRRLAVDATLYVIKSTNMIESLPCNL